METEKIITLTPAEAPCLSSATPARKWRLAFGVAAVSDVFSIWLTFAPPFQWALDSGHSLHSFSDFRQAMGTPAGACYGGHSRDGSFSWWVLVVVSIILYDGIKKPANA